MSLPAAKVRRDLLAQVELLVLFHPSMQSGGAGRVGADKCANASQGWLTVDVHGRRATGELSGRPVLEDTRFEVGGEDIEHLLPDSVVNDVCDYILND